MHSVLTLACAAQMLRVAVRDPVEVAPVWAPPALPDAGMIYAEVANFADKPRPAELNADDLIARLIRVFKGQVRLACMGPMQNRVIVACVRDEA
jgi:hypothetical protein